MSARRAPKNVPLSQKVMASIPIHWIDRRSDHPRSTISEASLRALSDSIRQYGLISPLVVRPKGGRYELIAGERRLRALIRLGMTEADVIIWRADDLSSRLIALIENTQREDLHFFEEAQAYRGLLCDTGMRPEVLAHQVGRAPIAVMHRLQVLRLTPSLREEIERVGLTERHARALLRLPTLTLQRRALQMTIRRRLNAHQLEAFVRAQSTASNPPPTPVVKTYCRDGRLLVNAVLDTVKQMNQLGISATSEVIDREEATQVIVTIAHPAAEGIDASR